MNFDHLRKLIGTSCSEAKHEPESGMIRLRNEDVPFIVVRSARRKRTIAFTIDPGASLRVMAPKKTRLPVIQAMLRHRADWILLKISDYKKVKQAHLPRDFADGENVFYLGHRFRLEVTRHKEQPQGCLLRPHIFIVNMPDNLSAAALREEVRLEILLWLKKRAKIKFKRRMDYWALRLQVDYKKILVTDPSRQWGSCTVDNVVRLNWRLMMAPLALVDYVVAHELSHVVHKNHSKHFWDFLAAEMPDYLERRKKLRQMGGGLVL